MRDIQIDFSSDKPLDVPWPDEVREQRTEIEGLDDIDLAGLYREISKVRLEVVKASHKRSDGPEPLSEEKGVRFLTTAINELRRIQPEIANLSEEIEARIRERHLADLFPIIDSFDRFFESTKDVHDQRFHQWVEGIRAIYTSVMLILRNNDVQEIPAHGTFNPKYQTAIGTETRNDLPPNTIVKVERRGFIVRKKILRTPEVIISKRSDIITD